MDLDAVQSVIEIGSEPSLSSTKSDNARLVAAMTRVSTRRAPWPPTRSTDMSWIARSSFACAAGEDRQPHRGTACPPARCSNLPRRPRHTGCRAILDTEELGLEQGFDERGAVDGDEWTAPAAAELVNLTGDELLAGPSFAFDEHREVSPRARYDRGPRESRRSIRSAGPHQSARPRAAAPRRPVARSISRIIAATCVALSST